MKNKIDLSNAEVDYTRAYGGANGSKIGIKYEDSTYMLKFPPKPTKNMELSYSNSCFSEYLSCRILREIGLDAQETYLGEYKGKIVVICKDFTENNKRILDFASIKNTIIDSGHNGAGTELTELLETINSQKQLDTAIVRERFWDMFIADSFLGNFDRHNGNWAFLNNLQEGKIELAPIYDCGSCLFPQNTDKQMENILKNTSLMEERVYSLPSSAIKNNGKKINYYQFLTETDNQDCLKSLKKITEKIDLEKINKIVEETPYISDIHKKFVQTILKERKERILDKALELNKNLKLENPFKLKLSKEINNGLER